jgi:hypothetical protein
MVRCGVLFEVRTEFLTYLDELRLQEVNLGARSWCPCRFGSARRTPSIYWTAGCVDPESWSWRCVENIYHPALRACILRYLRLCPKIIVVVSALIAWYCFPSLQHITVLDSQAYIRHNFGSSVPSALKELSGWIHHRSVHGCFMVLNRASERLCVTHIALTI